MVIALFEAVVSSLISLALSKPYGSLKLNACEVVEVSDWYPVFFNPKLKFTTTKYCAQEVVYPL